MNPYPGAFSRAATLVSSCTIDVQSLERQNERHVRLAPSVVQMRHEGPLLVVDFAPDLDRQALDELIAVERECCPFFDFSYDERSGHLEVGVRDPDAAQALDAIIYALSPRPSDACHSETHLRGYEVKAALGMSEGPGSCDSGRLPSRVYVA